MSSPNRRVISHTVVADSHRDFRGAHPAECGKVSSASTPAPLKARGSAQFRPQPTSLTVDLQDSKVDC